MYICTTVTACCMLVIANSIRTHLDCVQVTSSVRFYARFCCSLLWPPKSVAQRRTRRVHSASINVEYTYFLLHPNINQSEIILHILMTIYLPLFFHISFAANEDTSALCSPNLNSPTITFWFRLNKFIIRLCSTHQFKNLQVSGIFLYSHNYKKHWDFAIAMANLTDKITKSHLFLVDEKVIWKENRKQFLSLSAQDVRGGWYCNFPLHSNGGPSLQSIFSRCFSHCNDFRSPQIVSFRFDKFGLTLLLTFAIYIRDITQPQNIYVVLFSSALFPL